MAEKLNKSVLISAINYCAGCSEEYKTLCWGDVRRVVKVYRIKDALDKFGYDTNNFTEYLMEFLGEVSPDEITIDENNFSNILYKNPPVQQKDF